ncbi:hypothetical protein [Acetobacter malorum]|nr:hypothetical protein [Acetobacter malorum]
MEEKSSKMPHSVSMCREVAQKFSEIHETKKKFDLINEEQWNFLCGWSLEAVQPENGPPIPSYHTIDAFRQCGNDLARSCGVEVAALAYPASSTSLVSSGVATLFQILRVMKSTSAAGAWGGFISEAMKFYDVVFLVALRGFSQKYGGIAVPLEPVKEFSEIRCASADEAVRIALRRTSERDLNESMDITGQDGSVIRLSSIQEVNEFLSILDRAYFYQDGKLEGRYIHAQWGKGNVSLNIAGEEMNTTWASLEVRNGTVGRLLNLAGPKDALRAGSLRYGWI